MLIVKLSALWYNIDVKFKNIFTLLFYWNSLVGIHYSSSWIVHAKTLNFKIGLKWDIFTCWR